MLSIQNCVILSVCLFGVVSALQCTLYEEGVQTGTVRPYAPSTVLSGVKTGRFMLPQVCNPRSGLKVVACDDVGPVIHLERPDVLVVDRKGSLVGTVKVDITAFCAY